MPLLHHSARRNPAMLTVTLAVALMLSGCGSGAAADNPVVSAPAGLPSSAAGPSDSMTGPTSSAGSTTVPPSQTASSQAPSSTQPAAARSSGASSLSAPAGRIGPDGCITDFDPDADYFPDKATLYDAKVFTISYHLSYQVLTVIQPSQGAPPESYLLVRCGAPKPELTGALATAQQIVIPVHSLFSGSTTQLPSLVMLDQLDVLTGVGSKSYISEKKVLAKVASPTVVEYADAAGTVDQEKVVTAKPDVLITGGFADPAYAKIQKAGVPVLADADWLENSPLGRAEWIKFFAALTDTQGKAGIAFDQVATAYHDTKALAANAPVVQVVTGQPYQGTWYVPGGGSYTAALIADAAGSYPWAKDPSTGSISTDVETVFAKSGTAPVWLASTTWTTQEQALAENSAFAKFTAFADHNVWNAAKDVTASGGNNFYELGAVRPDLILGDLVAILHPDLMPDHDFAFYLKLT